MNILASYPRRVAGRSPTGRLSDEGIAVSQARIDALRDDLRRSIEGEVRFSQGDRALYSTDASNYRQVPYGVVIPRTTGDAVTAVRLCRDHEVPITPRGGGTSLAGQTCNTTVLIDFSKYLYRVEWIDAKRRLARVEPGCILDSLRLEAEEHALTFGPDPSTHDHNTLGGMIGNDSCGVHSIMAGRTADNVQSLDILTYEGTRMTVGPTSRTEYLAIAARKDRQAKSTGHSTHSGPCMAPNSRAHIRISTARLGLREPRSARAGERLQRRSRTGGDRGHLRDGVGRNAQSGSQPSGARHRHRGFP